MAGLFSWEVVLFVVDKMLYQKLSPSPLAGWLGGLVGLLLGWLGWAGLSWLAGWLAADVVTIYWLLPSRMVHKSVNIWAANLYRKW